MSSAMRPLCFLGAETASAACIFLHGLGDTAAGWEPVARMLSKSFPHIRFILPTAPSSPVTCNFGAVMPSWYDIVELGNRKVDASSAIKTVDALVAEQIEGGIPSERIVVGGFSQGGVVSLLTGLTSKRKLAGVIALSCYLAEVPRLEDSITEAGRLMRVFQAHGDCDQVIPVEAGQSCKEFLEELGGKVEFHEYRNMGHSFCDRELSDLNDWLEGILPPQQEKKQGEESAASSSSS